MNYQTDKGQLNYSGNASYMAAEINPTGSNALYFSSNPGRISFFEPDASDRLSVLERIALNGNNAMCFCGCACPQCTACGYCESCDCSD